MPQRPLRLLSLVPHAARLAVVALACASLSAGCVMGTHKEGRVIDARKVAQLKPGRTTKQQVLDLFGPPSSFHRVRDAELDARIDRRVDLDDDDTYLYAYTEESERFFSAVLLYTYFLRERLSDTLMVVFDERDRVRYVAFAKQTDAEPEDAPE